MNQVVGRPVRARRHFNTTIFVEKGRFRDTGGEAHLKHITNAAAALSLLAGASAASPALSADKSSAHKANCPYAKHKKAKRTTVAAKPQPARGIMLVEHRKVDVEILSFGP